MPARKAEINKNSRYAPYPVWKITELIKLIDGQARASRGSALSDTMGI